MNFLVESSSIVLESRVSTEVYDQPHVKTAKPSSNFKTLIESCVYLLQARRNRHKIWVSSAQYKIQVPSHKWAKCYDPACQQGPLPMMETEL